MSTTEMNIHFDLPINRSNVIKVIGVGGGGSNAINHMFRQGIEGVDFVVCNTDSQALENSPVPIKVQLGVNLTEGLGAGANPEVGEQAAIESFEELKTLLDSNTKMVFITAGMGGGTGTGAAPIIAKQARDMDILTVGIVTIPFKFEGKVRNEQAQKGVEKLRKNVDSLIVINNNKLREVYGNLGFKSGFSKADEVLATASRGIAEVITHHYTQNIDLRDAKTVLSNSGTAIMGSAKASGENRAQDAIKKALDSPLLNDNKITGAKNVLLLIVSGSQEITLDEIGEINDHIQEEAGNSANIIMGVGEDADLGEAIAVTIIATGFDVDQQNEIVNTESKKIIHTLEDEQTASHNLALNQPLRVRRKSEEQEEAAEKPAAEPEMQNEPEIIHTLKEEDFEDDSAAPEEEKKSELDEDDFVFIETKAEEDIAEQVSEPEADEYTDEEAPMFVFDLPKARTEETKPEVELPRERESSNAAKTEVYQQIKLFPEDEKNKDTKRYNLEDYIEKEQELMQASPDDKDEPRLKEVSEIKVKEEEEELDVIPEIDPLTSSISEGLAARAAERRARMKKFNYKFRKNSNIEDIERQPAYKRAGVELDDDFNRESTWSRTTVDIDEDKDQDEPRISRNNSYLHDNVD